MWLNMLNMDPENCNKVPW